MKPPLARRDLLKLGVGAALTATTADRAESQEGAGPRPTAPPPGSPRPTGELRPHT